MIRYLRMQSDSDRLEYLELLNELSQTGEITKEAYEDFVLDQNFKRRTFVYEEDKKIVGCLTIIIEPKLLHGTKSVMHIEDVVTALDYRGKGIFQKLFEHVVKYAFQYNCYKIILNCKEELEPFYQKFGFEKAGSEMRNSITL